MQEYKFQQICFRPYWKLNNFQISCLVYKMPEDSEKYSSQFLKSKRWFPTTQTHSIYIDIENREKQ